MLDVHGPTQTNAPSTPQADTPSAQPPSATERPSVARLTRRQASGLMWGAGLILLGALTLLALVTGWSVFGLAVLPALAIAFLIGGIARRSFALMVPAGILGGLSVGVVLAYVLEGQLASDAIGGLVTLSLGTGFLLIVALQALFTRTTMSWPYIPAALLILIGAVLLVSGSTSPLLQVAGYLWPAALLIVGAWILWRTLWRGPEDHTTGHA